MHENPETSEQTPEELARQAQRGSSAAFDALARMFAPRLVRYLRRCTPRHEDAEDISQETLMRAVRSLRKYDPRRPFGVWLFTIATRLASNHARRRAMVDLDSAAPPAASGPTPCDEAAAREEAGEIWPLARRVLEDRPYQALWLRYGEDMDIQQVAEILGVTRLHARVLLHRARRTIMNAAGLRGEQ